MYECFVLMYVCAPCVHSRPHCPQRPVAGLRFPGPGVIVDNECELPCRCWKLNPCPLEENAFLYGAISPAPVMDFVVAVLFCCCFVLLLFGFLFC